MGSLFGTFHSRRRGLTILALAGLGTPAALFLILRLFPGLDAMFQSIDFHLVIVSTVAACAVGIAIVAASAAGRSKDAPLVFVAVGCLSVGLILLGHGLTTPGIGGTPMNFWVGRLAQISVPVFAFSQALALIGPERRLARAVAAHPWKAIVIPGALLAGGLAFVVTNPVAGYGSRALPFEETGLSIAALIGGALLAYVGTVHWKRWRLSGDTIVLALSAACWLSLEALVSLRFGRMWHLSWWDYHVLLLLGFGSSVIAIVMGFLRTRDREHGLSHAYRRDPLEHIARGYPETLTTLVAASEARDSYTRGHTKRVTEIAAAIGQKLGIRPDELRKLVWGAELHDIGKIGIPDQIISKEGPLTPEERALIEEHPVIGWEIARQARSLNEVLEVIRHHHERIDGTGYPDRLAGEQIPLSARIVAVADVWDALTSDRSYRAAYPIDMATEIMAGGRGTQFDERCLDAFLDLLAEGRFHHTASASQASTLVSQSN